MDLSGLQKKATSKPKPEAQPKKQNTAGQGASSKRPAKAKKPTPQTSATPPVATEPPVAKPGPMSQSISNLHQPERGKPVSRQFQMDHEMAMEFDIIMAERGYNRRGGSDFFKEIWDFFKKHHYPDNRIR